MLPSLRTIILRRYRQHVVDFDGTAAWLTRDAGLDGAADGTSFIFSGTFKADADTGVVMHLLGGTASLAGTNTRVEITRTATEAVRINCRNGANTIVLTAVTAVDVFEAADGRIQVVIRINLTDAAKRAVVINGVDVSSGVTWSVYDTAGSIDFTLADWAVGGLPNGTALFDGKMADVGLWLADYDILSNITKFWANGRPVNPAIATAAIGVTPIVMLSGGPTPTWKVNDGSGLGFTEHGTLTDGSF